MCYFKIIHWMLALATLESQLLETKTLLTKRKRDQEKLPHSG